jgi:hypothetical protein
LKISYSPKKLPFQYDINSGTFTEVPQVKQNTGESSGNNEYNERQNFSTEQQALLNKKPNQSARPKNYQPSEQPVQHQGMPMVNQMGYAPIASQLAKQTGVQRAVPSYQDFMKQREPINQAQARMEATQGFPQDGNFKPNTDYTSVSMAPKFQSDGSKEFAATHTGLSNPSAIYDILQQGKALEEKYRNAAEGNYTPLTMGQIAQQRMDSIPQDMAWARQNPFTKEMGYQWVDDAKLGQLGWGTDDIASMKARTEFHPQEIEELYHQGAIRAPYREYLAEQERLRQQAEAEAARVAAARAASYPYSEPDYYEPQSDNSSEVSAPAPAPQPVFSGDYSIQAPEKTDWRKVPLYKAIGGLFSGGGTTQVPSNGWTTVDGL